MRAEMILKTIKTSLKMTEKISPKISGKIAAEIFLRPRRHHRPHWERVLLKQASRKKTVAGLKIWQFGKFENKILLVHGWDGRGSQLGKFIEPLNQLGFSVVLFDGPAHGDSQGTKTNMRQFSEHLMILEDEFGPFHAIIGHSFGAGASVLALSKGFEANKVVLIAGPSDIESIFDKYSDFFALNRLSRHVFKKTVEKEAKVSVKNLHLSDIVCHLVTDAMIIHDPADRDVPYEDSLKIHKAWAGSEMYSPHGVGHRRILKDDDVIKKVMEFIKK